MEISFDPVKRALTLAERGLDFAEAAKVFAGPVFEFEDKCLSGAALLDHRSADRSYGRGDLDRERERAARHIDEESQ